MLLAHIFHSPLELPCICLSYDMQQPKGSSQLHEKFRSPPTAHKDLCQPHSLSCPLQQEVTQANQLLVFWSFTASTADHMLSCSPLPSIPAWPENCNIATSQCYSNFRMLHSSWPLSPSASFLHSVPFCNRILDLCFHWLMWYPTN